MLRDMLKSMMLVVLTAPGVATLGCTSQAPVRIVTPTVPISTPPPPTLTPTAILTPTATAIPVGGIDPDHPEAGPRPADASGQDVVGNWTKKVRTVTYTWIKVQYGSSRDAFVQGWFRQGTVDPRGLPILDKDQYVLSSNAFYMIVYFSDAEPIPPELPYLDHPKTVGYTAIEDKVQSFTEQMFAQIGLRYFDITRTTREPREHWFDLLSALQGQSTATVPLPVTLPYITPDGIRHDWKIGPAYTYSFYEIPWEQADPDTHPGFEERGPIQYDDNAMYRYAMTVDEDGNLIGLGAVPDITALTDVQLVRLALIPVLDAVASGYTDEEHVVKSRNIRPSLLNLPNRAVSDKYGSPHFTVIWKSP
jgi:hypothetical protein